MIFRLFTCLLLSLVLVSCVSPVQPSTLTPTWEYSASTLAPTGQPLLMPPTEIPPDANVDNRGQTDQDVASLPWDSEVPPVIVDTLNSGEKSVQVSLQDGRLVTGVLYENIPSEQALITPRLPGVLLIGEPIDQWGEFPRVLNARGFIVLVVDMQTYETTSDFLDVVRSFSNLRTVDSTLIGIIGANEGADEALIGCAIDDICGTIVLLSPLNRDTLTNVIVDFNPRPLLAVASQQDAQSIETVNALQQVMSASSSVVVYDNVGFGAEMLVNQPDLLNTIIVWLQEKLVD